MTIGAAYAARPTLDSAGTVGVFADSRGSFSTGVSDDEDKLVQLGPSCCAVIAGAAEVLAPSRELLDGDIARLGLQAPNLRGQSAALWELTGALLTRLRAARVALGVAPSRPTLVVVSGFLRDGSPAVAEACLQGDDESRLLFVPREGETVARVIGPVGPRRGEYRDSESWLSERGQSQSSSASEGDAVPIVAGAIRLGVATTGRFDALLSVLGELAASPAYRIIGGSVRAGFCASGGLFRIGDAIEGGPPPLGYRYDRQVHQRLDAQHQEEPFFTGGRPTAFFIRHDVVRMGWAPIFDGSEPFWLTDGGPVMDDNYFCRSTTTTFAGWSSP